VIEINLLPLEYRGGKVKRQLALPALPYRKIFIALAVAAVAGEALLAVLVFQKKAGLAGLEAELERLDPDAKRIQAVKTETTRLQGHLRELEGLTTRDVSWTRLLNAVSEGMTDDVWLTQISLTVKREALEVAQKSTKRVRRTAGSKKERAPSSRQKAADPRKIKYILVLNGTVDPRTDSTAAVGRFIKSLESSAVIQEYFSKVWLEKLDRIQMEDTEQFDFTVSCLFKPALGKEFGGIS
jgi:hypothetical protein